MRSGHQFFQGRPTFDAGHPELKLRNRLIVIVEKSEREGGSPKNGIRQPQMEYCSFVVEVSMIASTAPSHPPDQSATREL